MNITSATNPRTKDAKTYIDLDITLDNGDVYPFAAMPSDPLGLELYKKAKRGGFGKVAIAPAADYQWNGSQWIAPTIATMITDAEVKKRSCTVVAESAIAPLERAVRLNMATKDERDKLEEWETYSVLISRIDTSQAPDIDWPVPPSL